MAIKKIDNFNKHQNPSTNKELFDVENYLNVNWDKAQDAINNNADELATAQDKIFEVEKEQQTQNTNIEKLQINDTKQNELISKLQEENKKLKSALINAETEGQSIHIEDSSDLEGKLEILGNVEQDVREGYNILENILTDKTVNGITVKINKDKSITLNGTATSNTSLDITGNFAITEQSIFSGMCDGYGYNKMLIQIQGTDYNVNIPNSTPQVLQAKDNVKARIYIYAGTSITNALIKPQINKGTVAKLYEQYGASPSPEYPSEIRAVGDNINLLENTAKTQTVNGVTFTVNEDGTVIANGTATSLAQISLVANIKLPAGTYTIKDGKAYVESTEFNDWFDGLNNPSTLTFNTEVLLKKVYIQVKQGETVNNKIFYPKLEKGTVATSYSKYGQGSVEIKKQNKNLFDISKYPFTNKVAYSRTGELNYWTGYCGIIGYFPVKEDTNYVFSNNLNKPITYGLMFYNKNKEFISGIVENTTKFVTPKNCKYIRFAIQSDTLPIWVQIELGDTATEYVEHEQTDYILNIQQEMLKGDYFIKEDDGWKEVHNYPKKTFDGTENWIKSGSSTDDIFVATLNLGNAVDGYGYSNYFKYNQRVGIRYFTIYNNGVHIRLCVDGSQITTVDEFKSWLQEKYNAGNPIYVFYKLATPTKLPCTSEQSVVLEELNNLDLFKPVTNIVTAENIANLKLKYALDIKTYVNNLLASQI